MGIKRHNKIKPDIILKDFWRDNQRFADLFNTVLFNGKEVLKAEDLQEQDTDASGIIEFKEYKETIARARDVVKKSAFGVDFVIYGIENQKKIHYAMPLRNMIYDALGYLKEYQQFSRENVGVSRTKEEFLSGLTKEDRLHPIITIVLYYGERPWDGPLSLRDMMNIPEELSFIFSDYRMNLLQIRNSGEYHFKNQEVETVFTIAREIFNGEFEKIKEQYRSINIKSELATVIGAITDSVELIEQAESSKEVINMCKALERLQEDAAMEKAKDIIRKMLKKGCSVDEIQEMTELPVELVKDVEEELHHLV